MTEAISAVSNVKLKDADREELARLQEEFLSKGGQIYKAEIGEKVDYKPEQPVNAAQQGKLNHEDKVKNKGKTLNDILEVEK